MITSICQCKKVGSLEHLGVWSTTREIMLLREAKEGSGNLVVL